MSILDDFGRIPTHDRIRRHITRHQSLGRDDGSGPDLHACKDSGSGANPYVVAYLGKRFISSVLQISSIFILKWMGTYQEDGCVCFS